MYLRNNQGDYFRLKILKYQFPHITKDYYDANWLKIHIDASINGREWSAEDPCLLTYEVETLIQWLDEISTKESPTQYCSFTEPCLEFKRIESSTATSILRVFIDYNLLPPWKPSKIAGNEDLYIDFPIIKEDIRSNIHLLRTQLQNYPVRGVKP
jgi:hypothetical protein